MIYPSECTVPKNSKERKGEQDGGEVGGCGVYLSPWIHQEHTFRHRSACRTPAEGGKECIEPHKTW